MGRLGRYTRRAFLGLGVAAAGGLAVGYYFYRKPYANPLEAALAEGDATFNPYLKIAADDTITVIAPRAEMGQGVQTTLAALVAEELDVDLERVRVEHGPASPAYYNAAMLAEGGPFPFFDESLMAEISRGSMKVVAKFLGLQVTGGSSATIDAFVKMRQAGAAARHVLKQAAAARWGVAADGLGTAGGAVTNPANGETLTYGALAAEAATLDPPAHPTLRPRRDWRLLGRPQRRVEGREKVTGGRLFGIDVQLPDMLYGTVKISPRFGVGARSVDTAPALAIAGVRDVVPIETTAGKGFGIIADNTWAAFRGAEALRVEWDDAPYPADDAGIEALYRAALDGEPSFSLRDEGDAAAALADARDVVSAEYAVPFLAHATMEPMNATAQLRDGRLTVWTGTQAPGIVQTTCANLLGLDSDDVTVHVTYLGGGFGRRAEADYSLYAAALAAKSGGRPIKVTWSREEDTRHDTYRPAAMARMRARLDGGRLRAMEMTVAAPSIVASILGRTFPSIGPMGDDKSLVEGAFDQPLEVEDIHVSGAVVDLPIPVGFWRSVGNSVNGFFHECFLDEVAEAAGADPLAFRLAHMNDAGHAPAKAVLRKVAEMSGWGTQLAAGRGRGIAHTISFGTWVAQVVEVSDTPDGIRIDKVFCAADPGVVLDPRNFEAQMMSGIVFGLSQALGQAITFADGQVVEGNFDRFDAMRMAQCPAIEVAILETSPKMGGAGEPGTPPAAAALANAVYRATGRRIRRMPLSRAVAFA